MHLHNPVVFGKSRSVPGLEVEVFYKMNTNKLILRVKGDQLVWEYVPANASVSDVLSALRSLADKLGLRERIVQSLSAHQVTTHTVMGKERCAIGFGRDLVDLGVIREIGQRDLFNPPLLNRPRVPLVEILTVAEALVQKYFPELGEVNALEVRSDGSYAASVGLRPATDQIEAALGLQWMFGDTSARQTAEQPAFA